jgi:hypothetical protein
MSQLLILITPDFLGGDAITIYASIAGIGFFCGRIDNAESGWCRRILLSGCVFVLVLMSGMWQAALIAVLTFWVGITTRLGCKI